MIQQEHLDQFSPALTRILREEVEKGNRVDETAKGWPEERTIMVFLKKPFVGTYGQTGVEYREINDPHYWKSEYFERHTGHILACKYGDTF